MAKNRGTAPAVSLASIPRELKPLAKRAMRAGVTIEAHTSGHYVWRWPTGEVMRTSATPRDPNVRRVVERVLRKRGLALA